MKRKTVIIVVVCSLLLLVNMGILIIKGSSNFLFTANVPLTGSITLTILEPLVVEIISPENRTYNFTYSEAVSRNPDDGYLYFKILLNATSNRDIENWTYTVLDNNSVAYYDEEPIFDLGSLKLWRENQNNLTVFAQPVVGSVGLDNVSFYVNLTSAAPEIPLTNAKEFLVCEGTTLTSAILNVKDVNDDLDKVYLTNNYRLFYQSFQNFTGNHEYEVRFGSIKSLQEPNEIRTYETAAVAKDLEGRTSPEYSFNITVIELNDAPSITSPPSLPDNESEYDVYVKLYLQGEHTTYDEVWTITDEESGNLSDGNLELDLTYSNGSQFDLFSIDEENGRMFYEATENSPLGSYSLTLNITDKPLSNPSENIGYCSGVGTGSSKTLSKDIYFVISDDNRAPEIRSYYPSNETLIIGGNDNLYFNISLFDDDHDLLYTKWFVGGRWLEQHGSFEYNGSDEFSYLFGCGIGGWYNITVSLSDGVQGEEVNHTWQIYVNGVTCPVTPGSSGGGGGGGGSSDLCYENWVCNDWATCQELTGSTKDGLLDGGDYQKYIEQCKQLGYDKENWGFQLRECYDVNACNNFEYRYDPPEESQVCFFVENPSCSDGLKNCHDGKCEIAIDCGGPCSVCPNCDDGIKNQNEEGIDCGGPCPTACEFSSADVRPDILLILTILFILILLFVIYRVIVILRKRKERREDSRQAKIHELFNQ